MPEITDANFYEKFNLYYTNLLPKNPDKTKNILTKIKNDGFLDITKSYCNCPVTVELRNLYKYVNKFIENFQI